MSGADAIPVFAVLGHPNEGKSSVVSTLTEDDTVPISALPGETRFCREYPVMIDGVEVIRFVDTPGFQVPRKTLHWFQSYRGPDTDLLACFLRAHRDDPRFREDCELLRPVAEGAAILYVVDGSRPIRAPDEAEMEILRRTGRPRMALINSKDPSGAAVADWKRAFAKTFNMVRVFDAHHACFAERIALLEALRAIEQDWGERVQQVIDAFRRDWDVRLATTAEEILDLLQDVRGRTVSGTSTAVNREALAARERELAAEYAAAVSRLEADCHRRIRRLFKHNLFRAELPPQTILASDLFAAETWSALGLTRRQLAAAMAVVGAAVGAGVDTALAQLTFGIFTTAGALAGGIGGFGATRPLARLRVRAGPFETRLGGRTLTVGPLRNPQLVFVLLDRALLYVRYVSNWAHAHRTAPAALELDAPLTARWPERRRSLILRSVNAAQSASTARADRLRPAAIAELKRALEEVERAPAPAPR